MSAKCLLSLVVLLVCGLATAAVPTVTAVNPVAGVDSGGQKVTITGTNFNTPAVVAVTFGGTSAVSFNVINNTTIIAETPFHAAGVVSVEVNNGAGSAPNALYEFKTDNPAVQVTAKVTLRKAPAVQWGNGTTNDDGGVNHTLPANRISPYTWIVKDSEFGAANLISLNTVYLTNDTQNGNKVINVASISPSNSTLNVSAICTNAVNFALPSPTGITWTGAAAANTDVFRMRASLGSGSLTVISPGPGDLTGAAGGSVLVKGADQPLVLEFHSPTAMTSTTAAGAQQTITVSLIATAN